MIILDATTKTLEVDLAGAVSTNQLPVTVNYVDVTTTTYTPGSSDTATNSTTAVTIVSAPAASTQRQVKLLTVYNADTASATVTIQLNNNATLRSLVVVVLAVGSTLIYTDGEGWRVLTSAGAIVTSTLSPMTSAQLATIISDETGSGALVFATSPTLVTPALGTPSALVGTSITGTAAGLTAGNVTTNANLTGPITSTGNATAVALQTGTGTTFVMDTNPTLVTPNLGTPSAAVLTNATGLPITGLTNNVITLLATTTSIDAKTVAITTLYTVPGGKTLIPDHVVIRCTAFTVGAKSVQAVASFGSNSATWDNYLNTITYTIAAVDTFIRDSLEDTATPIVAAAGVFKISIETGSNATTETWAVDLWGYLI